MKIILSIRKRFPRICFIILCAMALSCNKDELLNKNPITSLNSTNALVTESDFTALTNAAYDPIQWQVGSTAPQAHIFPVMFQDIRADNVISQWASYWVFGAPYDDLRLIQPNDPSVAALWQKWYTAIARANTAIHFDSLFTGFVTQGLQNRLMAEAKFIRAFANFQLVIHFGDVPLITTYIGSTSDKIIYNRTPVAQVYDQIRKDLTDAAAELPSSYTANDLGRATSGAAYTLLAKVCLYQKDYPNTVKYTELVMQSNAYSLESQYKSNWDLNNEYGKESIFEIGYQSGINNLSYSSAAQGSTSYLNFGLIPAGTGAFGNGVPRQGLIDQYDNADTRKDATLIIPSTYLPDLGMTADSAGANAYQYYWTNPDALVSKANMRKYYITKQVALSLQNIGSSPLNEKVLRYADVLLMHAEASLNTGGNGLASLNQVIERAFGNPSYNLTSYTLNDVKLQRRLELATEGWDRFTDLVRWNDAATVLAFKHFTVGRDELLPIPQAEIDLVGTSVLPQNPGY